MKIDLSKSKLNSSEKKVFEKDVYDILEKYPVLKNLNIMIEFSNRMRTTAGNVTLKLNELYTIRISTKNVESFGISSGIGTLRHEFAHILDYLRSGKFSHGNDFKRICADLGGTMNSQMAGSRFANCATNQYLHTPFKYEYQCKCGLVFKRKGKIRNTNQACMKCRTKVLDMNMKKL